MLVLAQKCLHIWQGAFSGQCSHLQLALKVHFLSVRLCDAELNSLVLCVLQGYHLPDCPGITVQTAHACIQTACEQLAFTSYLPCSRKERPYEPPLTSRISGTPYCKNERPPLRLLIAAPPASRPCRCCTPTGRGCTGFSSSCSAEKWPSTLKLMLSMPLSASCCSLSSQLFSGKPSCRARSGCKSTCAPGLTRHPICCLGVA